MTSPRIKAALVLLLMLLTYAGAQAWRPHTRLADSRPKVDLETLFPKRFGDWAVDDRMPVQLVSPDTQAMLNKLYNQTLSRTYINRKGDRIMLSVAYGGDQSDATRSHRPEVCYPAQGFQIMSSGSTRLDLGSHQLPVRQLVAKLGGRIEPITYWITVGERITVTGTEQKLAQLSYSTRGIVPDGMLVRVSSIEVDSQLAYRVQQGFVAEMAKALPVAGRAQVLGASAASAGSGAAGASGA